MARSTRAATGKRSSPAVAPRLIAPAPVDEEQPTSSQTEEEETAAAAATLTDEVVVDGQQEEEGMEEEDGEVGNGDADDDDDVAAHEEVPHRPVQHTVFGGHLTDEIRRAIVQKHRQEPDMSQVHLTDWLEKTYGIKVNRTTVGRTLQRTKLQASPRKSKKADDHVAKPSKKLDLDEAVYQWYVARVKSLEAVPSDDGHRYAFGVDSFREKAAELARTGLYEVPAKATFTDRWLAAFLKRFSLQVTEVSVDGTITEADPAHLDERAAANWPTDLLKYLEPGEVEEGGDGEESNGDAKAKRPHSNGIVRISGEGTTHRWTSQQHITLEMREALKRKRQEEPNISQHQLSGWLNATFGVRVHRATIGRNLKRSTQEATAAMPTEEPAGKKAKGATDPVVREFEQALVEWFAEEKASDRVPSDRELLDKARELEQQMEPAAAAKLSITLSWRNGFKTRHGLATRKARGRGSFPNGGLTDAVSDGATTVSTGPPSMAEVHTSVNLIRSFVFNASYDAETKKELMQGLDDIYIKLGDANKELREGAIKSVKKVA